ncbi:sulfite exporter TauE/SafE family protein [Amaricoccus sp.]|uniref:sulfite exporter TauE/SafE family protein n=1 Tax=Amaricoccus sp. TaxID=1872485 RepID=UPI00260C58A6|nr:sulfite exporter TauE/SafE family protein [Amaricoccus sp.]HRO10447.1 sulfite exporter TauE/SafE family protein [Amaricoccus sp.]
MAGLEGFVALYGVAGLLWAGASVALGGFAKGVVGFALPLIALALAGSFLPYEVGVALLIVPMLVSNLFQALRQGIGPALGSLQRFWRLNLILVAMILVSAQLVVALPDRLLFGILGGAVTFFGASQLAGWRPRFDMRHRARVETGVALVAGFFGGLSGIWGPPLVMYLVAVDLPKTEMVRTQSLSFLLGSAVLLLAHLHSGVLDAMTLPVSAWMTVPAMLGMFVGYRVHDRLDQRRFLTLTLAVLVLSGLNLLRRALF